MLKSLVLLLSLFIACVVASPINILQRAAADNIVSITDAKAFCIIAPHDPHTDIGDSEHPGGEQTFCSTAGKTSPLQGTLVTNFWSKVAFKAGNGTSGQRFAQLTGCIRPETLDPLNPKDDGGQYDSSGGAGGKGNPQGSVCLGFKHYVELIEPSDKRACIRCCDNPKDCRVSISTAGCPAIIPGNYFNCS